MLEKSPIIAKGKFIFPVFHTGGLGLRNRKKELQVEDWERIKKEIDKIL